MGEKPFSGERMRYCVLALDIASFSIKCSSSSGGAAVMS